MDVTPSIPGYEVHERLGSGGMGDVYRATSLSDRRSVALKIEGDIVAIDPGSGLRERFLREARILQGLSHENLPEFYEAGGLADGRLFIAMELLVGRPLSKFAGSKPEQLVPLLVQAASALQIVSEAGVVHRDVSPDNFFVVEVGGRSVVKLIDFGISRDVQSATDGLTRVGSFVGKPAYSSPEQTGLLPDSSAVDWRTDLYSFGLTAYYLLRGRLPFAQGSVLELMRARLKQLPDEAFREIEGERLQRLIVRLLRLDPDDRPDSFEEVVTELLHVQADLAAETAQRMEDSWRHRRKTTGKGRRSQTVPGPPTLPTSPAITVEPSPPPGAATDPSGSRSAPATSVASHILLAPRLLLTISISLLAAVLLAIFLGAVSPRSLLASGLILLALAMAGIAALRQRTSQRDPAAHTIRDRNGLNATLPEYVGDPSAGVLLPFSLLVTGDGPDRTVRVVRRDGQAAMEIPIGRAVGPEGIHLSTKTVSGLQANLLWSPAGCRIQDASRSNPTLVNSGPLERGEKRPLRDGDRVQIAEVTLLFRSEPV